MFIKQLIADTDLSIKDIADKFGFNYHSARRWKHEAEMVHRQQADQDDDALFDDLEKLAELSQSVRSRIDPVITHATIPLPGSAAILMAGCLHMGSRWTVHSMIREKLMEVMGLPGLHIGLFGDEVDDFISGSFAGAASVYDQALAPDLQRKMFELFIDRIKDRVLFGLWGQHGALWDKKQGWHYIKELYTRRGITYFDGQGYIKLYIGNQVYNVAVSHKFPGHSMYNPVHAQKRVLWQRFPNADLVVMGDKHTWAVHQESIYQNEYFAGNRPSPYVTLLQIGTAKIGPDPYTIMGWERGQSEWPFVWFSGTDHEIKVTTDLEDVKMWLARYNKQ